jgi:hypothetical protein
LANRTSKAGGPKGPDRHLAPLALSLAFWLLVGGLIVGTNDYYSLTHAAAGLSLLVAGAVVGRGLFQPRRAIDEAYFALSINVIGVAGTAIFGAVTALLGNWPLGFGMIVLGLTVGLALGQRDP